MKSLPDLRKVKATVRTEDGQDVDLSTVPEYRILIDHWSAKVSLRLTLPDGTQVKARIPSISAFAKNVQSSMCGTEASDRNAP